MDLLITVCAVLAVFAMIHERALELLRVPRELVAKWEKDQREGQQLWTHVGTALDALTIGSFNWVSGVILATVTHADLLLLLKGDSKASLFFERYVNYAKDPWTWDVFLFFTGAPGSAQRVHFFGCLLMGLSTTVGSKFWHDMLSGLVDLRKRVKATEADARKLTATELKQALDTAAHELSSSQAVDSTQALADTVRALKSAANKAIEPRPNP